VTEKLRRLLIAAVLIASLGNFTAGTTAALPQTAKSSTEVLVPSAVRKIFARNKIKLEMGEVRDRDQEEGKERLTFRVQLPYDPQSSQTATYFNRLYPAILDALGGAPYSLIDVTDAVRVDVNLDEARSKMLVEISPLN
jgi:hypothetical protein